MTDEVLMDAVGMLDDDLILDTEPRRTVRIAPLARIAAALLLLLGVGAVYGIFLAPAANVYLVSRESAVITLNSRGRVLSASGCDGLDGKTAEEAVCAVTREMLGSGALSKEENTLLLGTDRLSEPAREMLAQTVQDVFAENRFDGALVSLSCSDEGAKAAVIDLLLQLDGSLSRSSLLKLSANGLNQLLHHYAPDSILMLGKPFEYTHSRKPADSGNAAEPVPTEQTKAPQEQPTVRAAPTITAAAPTQAPVTVTATQQAADVPAPTAAPATDKITPTQKPKATEAPPQATERMQDFTDNEVMFTLTAEASKGNPQYTPDDFPGLGVIGVTRITNAEIVKNHIFMLTLDRHDKQNVLNVIEQLKNREGFRSVYPNYIYTVSSD